MALLGAALSVAPWVAAQDYPAKPIRIVLPVPPGAGTDVVARLVAERLQAALGQPAVIEHRAGAGGNIGAETVFRAAPDGYTLLLTGQGILVINKSLYAKINYDPEAFVPISLLASGLTVLVVHPRVPVSNLAQLIAFARGNPGKLNYASSGSGTIPHLAAELFNTLAGVNTVHVPYKGMAPGLADVLGGQVEMMFAGLSSALPQAREGKLRMLAIGSAKRNAILPDIPAMAEQLPGFAAENWFGLLAPPGTPSTLANRISAVVAESMKQPDVIRRLETLSFDAIGSTPTELALLMREESVRWAKVIRSTGARAE
ncbi:MAG: tripartite tricarboxylate transporter substrate binding protein [Betaproteobacteria bacterium]|nr:tripartite tricarboxylate transporter substrate binding protein [Betaproteobacteria bacterium]